MWVLFCLIGSGFRRVCRTEKSQGLILVHSNVMQIQNKIFAFEGFGREDNLEHLRGELTNDNRFFGS